MSIENWEIDCIYHIKHGKCSNKDMKKSLILFKKRCIMHHQFTKECNERHEYGKVFSRHPRAPQPEQIPQMPNTHRAWLKDDCEHKKTHYEDMATTEYEASIDNDPDGLKDDPETIADEAMSYWGD